MGDRRLLRLVRGVIAGLAERVAVGVFVWFKPPSNWYATLYPLAMLPAMEDVGAWRDSAVGGRIFHGVIQPAKDGPALSIGSYGEMIAMPGWCTEHRGKIAKSWSLAKQIEVLAGRVDAAWLEAHGRVDAEGTERVLAWLDEIIERVGSRGRVSMEFEETGLPADLRWAEVDGVRVEMRG